MSPTHFCLGTFTAESLKNNFGFKLGGEVSSFSFRHRILLSSRWILYHNLVLESGPNFRWQYTFAELTQSDLENIDKLIQASETRIKEYVDLKINASEAKLSGQIKALDERLSGQIKALDERLSGQIKALDERLSGQINALDGQMTQIYGFVIALVALIAVAVGLPQILVARQGKEMRTQDQRIEALQQEIEKLKQERIDRP